MKKRICKNWQEFPLPVKYSNVKLSRLTAEKEESVCSYCFPHGWETRNSHWRNKQKNWKKHRKTKYKIKRSLS